jgi:ATP-dependent RNA helicase DeaD
MVNNHRIAAFKQKITDTLASEELAFMQGLVEQYQREHDVPALEIAAALARLTIGDQPLLLKAEPKSKGRPERDDREPGARGERGDRPRRRDDRQRHQGGQPRSQDDRPQRQGVPPAEDKERFRIEIGRSQGVQPGNIVGAIANEAGIDGKHIGPILIEEDYSLVDLPVGMPREIFRDLKKAWICGHQLRISRLGDPASGENRRGTPPKGGRSGKPPKAKGPQKPKPARKPKPKPHRGKRD